MTGLRQTLQSLPPRGKAILAASVVGVLLIAFLGLRMAGQTTYATVLTGLDPAETGKITAALDEKGVPYELQNNGTALAVDKGRTAEARVALAEQGLPGRAKPGDELFDEQKLGMSEFEQNIAYQRAKEGEITRTIEQIDGVTGARVEVVMPQDRLFEEEDSAAKAAVLLAGDASALDPGAVRGIAQLTASSIEGLKPANVSITDGTGRLLWPRSEGDAQGGATAKQAAEARYAQQVEADLTALLASTIGPDKARVQVSADLNVDKASQDKLEYARRGTALKRKRERERLRGEGGALGAAGTEGNIPGYRAGAGGGTDYNRDTEETDYGVDKTVTRTQFAPGRVNRQSVGLLVDASVPPAAVNQLRQVVASAAGLDEERGDTLAISRVPFAAPQPMEEPHAGTPILDYLKWAALAVALALFVLFVARHLRRREDEALADPVWLREIQAPTTLAELERARSRPAPVEEDTLVLAQAPSSARRQVDAIAEREPERIAQQVRAWLNDD